MSSDNGDSNFQTVTEMPGDPVSRIQITRLLSRYGWAADYCHNKDVVEAGCGAGPGLGLLDQTARTLEAGDYCEPILERARVHYGTRIPLTCFDALKMPFANASKDIVVLFEAIYYLPSARDFVVECKRVLRPGGKVLLATANKDLWDFHPSAYSVQYFGVPDLRELFGDSGFSTEFFGFERAGQPSIRAKVLRLIKRIAVASRIMPRTMAGKRWLKRMVFGAPVPMPNELVRAANMPPDPVLLADSSPDTVHRIIYCAATLDS